MTKKKKSSVTAAASAASPSSSTSDIPSETSTLSVSQKIAAVEKKKNSFTTSNTSTGTTGSAAAKADSSDPKPVTVSKKKWESSESQVQDESTKPKIRYSQQVILPPQTVEAIQSKKQESKLLELVVGQEQEFQSTNTNSDTGFGGTVSVAQEVESQVESSKVGTTVAVVQIDSNSEVIIIEDSKSDIDNVDQTDPYAAIKPDATKNQIDDTLPSKNNDKFNSPIKPNKDKFNTTGTASASTTLQSLASTSAGELSSNLTESSASGCASWTFSSVKAEADGSYQSVQRLGDFKNSSSISNTATTVTAPVTVTQPMNLTIPIITETITINNNDIDSQSNLQQSDSSGNSRSFCFRSHRICGICTPFKLKMPLILLIPTLIFFLLSLVALLLAPTIIQKVINDSEISILSMELLEPEENRVKMISSFMLKPSISGMSATMQEVEMKMYLVENEESEEFEPENYQISDSDSLSDSGLPSDSLLVGSFQLPKITLHGGPTQISVNSHLQIHNQNNMVLLGKNLFKNKSLKIRTYGELGINKALIPITYKPTMDKTLELKGLDSLKNVITVKNLTIPGDYVNDGTINAVSIEAYADVNNPTNYTMDLGSRLTMLTSYQNVSTGKIWIDNFILKPGLTENVFIQGYMEGNEENQEAIGEFMGKYMQGEGGVIYMDSVGESIEFNSTKVESEFDIVDDGLSVNSNADRYSLNTNLKSEILKSKPSESHSVSWFTHLVQSMKSQTALKTIDARKFMKKTTVNEMGFSLISRDNITNDGQLEILMDIDFAHYPHKIISMSSQMEIGVSESQSQFEADGSMESYSDSDFYPAMRLPIPMIPVDYQPIDDPSRPDYVTGKGKLTINLPKNSQVDVVNETSFNYLLTQVFRQKSVTLRMKGNGQISMSSIISQNLTIPNVPIDTEMTIQGWNSLSDSNMQAKHMDMIACTNETIKLLSHIVFDNPTPLSAFLKYLPVHFIPHFENLNEEDDQKYNNVSLGVVEGYDQYIPSNSTGVDLKGYMLVNRSASGEWPSESESRAVLSASDSDSSKGPLTTVNPNFMGIRSTSTKLSDFGTAIIQSVLISQQEQIKNESVVEKVFELTMHNYMSNITTIGSAVGAYEYLYKYNLQFLTPFLKSIHVNKSVKMIPYAHSNGNLLTWVHLYMDVWKILQLKSETTMIVNNTFSSDLVLTDCWGEVYAGEKQDILLGGLNTTFPPSEDNHTHIENRNINAPKFAPVQGWRIPAKSVSQSAKVESTVMLKECIENPGQCLQILTGLTKYDKATVKMKITTWAGGVYRTIVECIEVNVKISLHGLPGPPR